MQFHATYAVPCNSMQVHALIHQSLRKELEHGLLEHAETALENGFQLAVGVDLKYF